MDTLKALYQRDLGAPLAAQSQIASRATYPLTVQGFELQTIGTDSGGAVYASPLWVLNGHPDTDLFQITGGLQIHNIRAKVTNTSTQPIRFYLALVDGYTREQLLPGNPGSVPLVGSVAQPVFYTVYPGETIYAQVLDDTHLVSLDPLQVLPGSVPFVWKDTAYQRSYSLQAFGSFAGGTSANSSPRGSFYTSGSRSSLQLIGTIWGPAIPIVPGVTVPQVPNPLPAPYKPGTPTLGAEVIFNGSWALIAAVFAEVTTLKTLAGAPVLTSDGPGVSFNGKSRIEVYNIPGAIADYTSAFLAWSNAVNAEAGVGAIISIKRYDRAGFPPPACATQINPPNCKGPSVSDKQSVDMCMIDAWNALSTFGTPIPLANAVTLDIGGISTDDGFKKYIQSGIKVTRTSAAEDTDQSHIDQSHMQKMYALAFAKDCNPQPYPGYFGLSQGFVDGSYQHVNVSRNAGGNSGPTSISEDEASQGFTEFIDGKTALKLLHIEFGNSLPMYAVDQLEVAIRDNKIAFVLPSGNSGQIGDNFNINSGSNVFNRPVFDNPGIRSNGVIVAQAGIAKILNYNATFGIVQWWFASQPYSTSMRVHSDQNVPPLIILGPSGNTIISPTGGATYSGQGSSSASMVIAVVMSIGLNLSTIAQTAAILVATCDFAKWNAWQPMSETGFSLSGYRTRSGFGLPNIAEYFRETQKQPYCQDVAPTGWQVALADRNNFPCTVGWHAKLKLLGIAPGGTTVPYVKVLRWAGSGYTIAEASYQPINADGSLGTPEQTVTADMRTDGTVTYGNRPFTRTWLSNIIYEKDPVSGAFVPSKLFTYCPFLCTRWATNDIGIDKWPQAMDYGYYLVTDQNASIG